MFDTLLSIESKISTQEKEILVYIAGYVTMKDASSEDDTLLYYEEFGRYTSTIDRGGLKHASHLSSLDNIFFYYFFFGEGRGVLQISK